MLSMNSKIFPWSKSIRENSSVGDVEAKVTRLHFHSLSLSLSNVEEASLVKYYGHVSGALSVVHTNDVENKFEIVSTTA